MAEYQNDLGYWYEWFDGYSSNVPDSFPIGYPDDISFLLSAPLGSPQLYSDDQGWLFRVTKTRALRRQDEFATFESIVSSVPKGRKWIDPDQPVVLPKHTDVVSWVFPRQLYGKHASFAIAGRHLRHKELLTFDLSDVRQGQIGDCYAFSGLSVLLQFPAIFARCIGRRNASAGVYEFVFYDSDPSVSMQTTGAPVCVCVDERIPVRQVDGELRPLYVSSDDHGEFWPQLFEKAYAKVLGGGYESLARPGWGGEAIGNFANGAGGMYNVIYNPQMNDPGALWARMTRLLNAGCFLCIGFRQLSDTALGSSGETSGAHGLAARHAYGVLDVYSVHGFRLVKLRNPWGKEEKGVWCGRWGPRAQEWRTYPAVARRLGHNPDDIGIFFMDFTDFAGELQGLMFAKVAGVNRKPSPPKRVKFIRHLRAMYVWYLAILVTVLVLVAAAIAFYFNYDKLQTS